MTLMQTVRALLLFMAIGNFAFVIIVHSLIGNNAGSPPLQSSPSANWFSSKSSKKVCVVPVNYCMDSNELLLYKGLVVFCASYVYWLEMIVNMICKTSS